MEEKKQHYWSAVSPLSLDLFILKCTIILMQIHSTDHMNHAFTDEKALCCGV